MSNTVLVYGGNGALGRVLIDHLKAKNYRVVCIDFFGNDQADINVLGNLKAASLSEQAEIILSQVAEALGSTKLAGLISVAGGWAGGNAASPDFIKNVEATISQSVWSSAIAARLAALHLAENGLLVLPGAAASLGPHEDPEHVVGTSSMIGYGANKAAVHHMVKSLSNAGSGLAENVTVIGTCPVILDTPMNRKFMADADFSTWTKREFVAETLIGWLEGKDRPENGSLVKIVTKNDENFLTFH